MPRPFSDGRGDRRQAARPTIPDETVLPINDNSEDDAEKRTATLHVGILYEARPHHIATTKWRMKFRAPED